MKADRTAPLASTATVAAAAPPAPRERTGVLARPLALTLQIAMLTLCYTVLALLLTWPLAAHLSSGIISPLDPLDSVWRVAQGQRQLLQDPTRLLDANIFYPYARSYLFDELLLGAALLTLPLHLFTSNPILIYNVAILSTFVLSGLGMHALARHLGCGHAAALLAGVSYAFAPFHLDHLPHLGLLSGQYFPLIILFLDRLFAAPRWRDAILLGLLLAAQALSAQYYALYLIFVVAGFVGLRLVQLAVRRQFPGLALWGRLVAAGALAAILVLPVAVAYRSVQGDFSFERSLDENVLYSSNVASFVTTDERNRIWGEITAPLREQGRYSPERNAFPGAIVLILAIVGVIASWRRWLPQYLLLLGLAAAVLALGPVLQLTGDPASRIISRMPYGFLYVNLPGFDSMRVPARFNILYGLAVAALGGLGLQWLLAKVGARLAGRLAAPRATAARLLPLGLAAVLIAGVVGESVNRPYPITTVPTGAAIPGVYRWLATQPNAIAAELPLLISKERGAELLNNRYQYYAYWHQRPVINGAGNVAPKGYQALYYELRDGPTARALSVLQGLGVTHLIVHYDQLDTAQAVTVRQQLGQASGQVAEVAAFGPDVAYRLLPTDRFTQLRALIPPAATIYLSREDPTGAYGGMLGRVLRENPIYTRVRVEYGQEYAGEPDPNARYDYAILYRQEDPATVGFAGGSVVWEDEVVRIYRRAGLSGAILAP
jgi:hypothetical protein